MSTNFEKNTINDLVTGVLNHGPNILKNCVTTPSDIVQQYLDRCAVEHLNYPIPHLDKFGDPVWLVPKEYLQTDIKQWLLDKCVTEEEKDRVETEIQLYNKHNMIPVLKTMRYIVDVLRENNIIWGVGRGSSVASYCLFLIGIHKINSIKYNLSIGEFFKGEENG
jgi:DNA polymerase III alpha subunit